MSTTTTAIKTHSVKPRPRGKAAEQQKDQLESSAPAADKMVLEVDDEEEDEADDEDKEFDRLRVRVTDCYVFD